MRISRSGGCILLLIAAAAALICGAQAECAACSGGSAAQQDVLNNEWAVFLGKEPAASTTSTATGLTTPQNSRRDNPGLNPQEVPSTSAALSLLTADADSSSNPGSIPKRGSGFAEVLVPVERASGSGIILDISPNSTEYIPGSINIPYTSFVESDGALKPVSQLKAILGQAGISEQDPVLIYGECQPCGGGPSAATFAYWIMKYLGHDEVRLLDGGIDDWVAAKLPTETEPRVLTAKSYTPALQSDLLAAYEYVLSGSPQIVDARTAAEFEAGAIPDAINIPYESILDGTRIQDETELLEKFAILDKDRPVVVYTNTGVKASMVWLALALLGYDARLYSWQDWQAKQPRLDINLREATAQPNPAKIGDVVRISAVFAEGASRKPQPEKASNETILTIKGCATCGFGGFSLGAADVTGNDTGAIRLGSAGQTAANDNFRCEASIMSSAGAKVGRVVMKRVAGDEFAGIWNANVAAGAYSVDIVASAGEITKTFPDALQIEVVRTSKYKNLGTQ